MNVYNLRLTCRRSLVVVKNQQILNAITDLLTCLLDCWTMAAKALSIDDIFGPKKGTKAMVAQQFKESFNSTSTTLTRSHPVCNNSEVAATLPLIPARQPSVVPPLKQTAAAASDTNVVMGQPPIRDSRTSAPRVVQGEVIAVPNYLRPRANVRTQEEVEAETVLRRARGLVHALNDMESVKLLGLFRGPKCCLELQPRACLSFLTFTLVLYSNSCALQLAQHPELDSAFLKRQRRAHAEQRAHELRLVRFLLYVNVPALSQKPQ